MPRFLYTQIIRGLCSRLSRSTIPKQISEWADWPWVIWSKYLRQHSCTTTLKNWTHQKGLIKKWHSNLNNLLPSSYYSCAFHPILVFIPLGFIYILLQNALSWNWRYSGFHTVVGCYFQNVVVVTAKLILLWLGNSFFPRRFWYLPFSKSSDRCKIIRTNSKFIYINLNWKNILDFLSTCVSVCYKMSDYTAVENNGFSCANRANENNVCMYITVVKSIGLGGALEAARYVLVSLLIVLNHQCYCCTCFRASWSGQRQSKRLLKMILFLWHRLATVFSIPQQLVELIFV